MTKYRSSFVLTDQSLALRQKVLSVSQMLMLLVGCFSQKFRVYFGHAFSKQHPPSMVRGCSLRSLFLVGK
jgi:hypothetical protein